MDKQQFLKLIAQLESNNGRNTNHPIVNYGVNKGTHAIGKYALMPATADELVKNNDPNGLKSLTPEQKYQYFQQHPEIQEDLAGKMYEHLSNRYHGDPQKMALGYNAGMYLPEASITPAKLESSPYVNKFNNLRAKLGDKSDTIANNMPEIQNNLKKDTKNLPTIGRDLSLEDILTDPNNPFLAQNDEDEENYL